MARSTRPHRPALLGLAIAAGLAVGGCSPIATQDVYSPGDGVRAVIGDEIRANNLLILTAAEGEEGVLVAGLSNLTGDATEITLTVGSETFTVPIGPRETVLLKGASTTVTGNPGEGGDGESPVDGGNPGSPVVPGHTTDEVRISSVPAPPGAVTDVTISTPSGGEITVPVPVLDGTLAPYDEVVPGGTTEV